jgi:hypothetical protein
MEARSHAARIAAATLAAITVCSLAPAVRAQVVEAAAARTACESALRLEAAGQQTSSSRGPCHQALRLGGLAEDLRNEVASSTQPRANLTLDGLVSASVLADAAVEKMPAAPWGYLARCDIAGRLGSAALMASCVADLRRLASQGATADGAPMFATGRVSLGIWALRALLAFGLLGTLGHALWHIRKDARRNPSVGAPVLAAVVLIATSFIGGTARAEPMPKGDLSSFRINDTNPEASVPSPDAQMNNPLQFGYYLQDLAARAERAAKKGNHAAAARLYGALTKASPTVAYGPRQMCTELEAAGDPPNAILACRTAITRLGSTVSDYVRFVTLVLATKGPLPAGEREELDSVIDHMKEEQTLGYLPTILGCEVAVRFDDFATAKSCADELAKVAPKDQRTITLQWALAVHNNDRSAAMNLMARAKEAGMSQAGLARMQAGSRALNRRWMQHLVLLTIAVALVGAGVWFTLRRLSGRRQVVA